MEAKNNLNNSQRKMLDEVYMEQFTKIVAGMVTERALKHKKLRADILKKEQAKEPVKSLMKKAQDAFEAYEKVKEYLANNGMYLENAPQKPNLTLNSSSYKVNLPHPDIEKFENESRVIEAKLNERRKEIRARIYGLEATYEQIEAEISRYIQDIKV